MKLAWYVYTSGQIQERPVKDTYDSLNNPRQILPSVMLGDSVVLHEQSYYNHYNGSCAELDGRIHFDLSEAKQKALDMRKKELSRLMRDKIDIERKIAELESQKLKVTTYREFIERGMEKERARLEKLLSSPTTAPTTTGETK